MLARVVTGLYLAYLAAPIALLALGSRDGALHSCRDAGRRPDGDVRLHAALPERRAALEIRRVHRPAHAVLVVPHVAVGHRDRIDVRIDEGGIPGEGVGDAVDVVPASGVEADEMAAEGGADLHQLEGRLELLDEDVDQDRADGQTEVLLERPQDPVPAGRLAGGLDLRQVEHHRRPGRAQALVVVHHVEREVDDRSREAGAVRLAHVAVVEVQAAGAEDLRREGELGAPVGDDLAAEEAARPGVHLAGDLLGDLEKARILRDRQHQVALVVERHRRHLAEGVLAVEHPAVGAG
jgi:hypothetical protein